MKRRIFASFFCLLLPLAMAAQALNPSVEVTNDFQTRVLDFDKKGIRLELPDSMFKFNTAFDYSVFSNPYKGAYHFNPYNVTVIPEAGVTDRPVLYLNAGAGYSFSPVLQAVWAPEKRKGISFCLYQDLNGYSGQYYGFGAGNDLSGTAGFTLGADLKHSVLVLDASYRLLYESDALINGFEHMARAGLRLLSKPSGESLFAYDINLKYDYSAERAGCTLDESRLRLYGTFSPETVLPFRFLVDFDAGFTDFSAMTGTTAYYLRTVPKALFDLWKIRVSAGITLAYADRMYVYPDISARLPLLRGNAGVFAGVSGAPAINSYASFKTADHHFNPLYASGGIPLLSNEKINLYGGAWGFFFSCLQLDAAVSWKSLSSSPLYITDGHTPGMVFSDFNRFTAKGRAMLDLKGFNLDANVCYTMSGINSATAFTDPAFCGGVSAIYNFKNRIRAGVSVDFATERHYSVFTMPLWVDLGINAEYKMTENLSVWLKGSNLLDSRIETVPLIARCGICLTAGVRMDIW